MKTNLLQSKTIILLLIILIINSCDSNLDSYQLPSNQIQANLEITKGKKLYAKHCQSCHPSDLRKGKFGPPLGNVTYFRDSLWLIRFTKNSDEMLMDLTDPISKILWNQWGPTLMGNFDTILSSEEINKIYDYIEYESINQGIKLNEVEYITNEYDVLVDDDQIPYIFGIVKGQKSNIKEKIYFRYNNQGFKNIKRILFYEYDIEYPFKDFNYYPTDENDNFQSKSFYLKSKNFSEKILLIFIENDREIIYLDELENDTWEFRFKVNELQNKNIYLIGLGRKKESLYAKKIKIDMDIIASPHNISLKRIGTVDDFLE